MAARAPKKTGPRTRSNTVPRQYRHSSDDKGGTSIEVPGRLGTSLLTGKAAKVYREFDPTIFSFPHEIPVNQEVEIWGRRWIVKETSLGLGCGLGVYACEDIHVDTPLAKDQDGPHLFPYIGPVYLRRHWKSLLAEQPSWSVYQLDMDTFPGSMSKPYHTRVIDGDPVRCGNIAGYINSIKSTKPKKRPNVEWIQIDGPPPPPYCTKHMDDHIMTVAIRSIAAGEELFCDYAWDPRYC